METVRMTGAASRTTGTIVIQETTQDSSQWTRYWVTVTSGKLAIPAAIRHVKPDWITAKIKWLYRRGIANISGSSSRDALQTLCWRCPVDKRVFALRYAVP